MLGRDVECVVRTDNSAAIDLIRAGYSRKLSYLKRWVGVDLGWLHELFYVQREDVTSWRLKLAKVDTRFNSADVYTKPLDADRHSFMRKLLGVI